MEVKIKLEISPADREKLYQNIQEMDVAVYSAVKILANNYDERAAIPISDTLERDWDKMSEFLYNLHGDI